MVVATERTDLSCPYEEKDQAKALGARWDNDNKKWYVPAGVDLDHFKRWMPERRHYLDVPFEEKDDAKALGARWEPKLSRWYVMPGNDVAPFARWDPQARAASSDAAAPATPQRSTPATTGTPPSTTARGRVRPRDEEGDSSSSRTAPPFTCPVHKCPLQGPRTVRNGQAHNLGRQFYVCPHKTSEDDCGLRGGFKWADGTDPFSAASCRRVEAHHGLSHDSVGVGISLSDGVQVVGDELRDGELVRPQVQRRRA